MEFATLAAFLVVTMVLGLGERGLRVRLARQGGPAGPNRQGPTYALATTVKLLARRPSPQPTASPRIRRRIPFRVDRLGSGLTAPAALLALATLPVGRDLQPLSSSTGVLVALTALGFALLGPQLDSDSTAGPSRRGGADAARRGVVVLVNIGLLLVSVAMIPGTADLSEMVSAQRSLFEWFAWRQPLGLALLCVLIVVVHDHEAPVSAPATARNPALFGTTHSGAEFGLRWLGVILTRVFLAALVVSLYLGGWSPGMALPDGSWWALLSVVAFAAKTLVVLCGILALRRILPEFRPDQVQKFGWKILLPCAVANILLTALGVTLYQLFTMGDG